MPKQRFCISFAGPVGSSKTPIAYFLSQKFSLPMINNDIIRIEVIEEKMQLDIEEYEKRRNERTEKILQSGQSFIFDASVDRSWDEFIQYLVKYNYQWFVISMDLSKDFLSKIYQAKDYQEGLRLLDKYYQDHQDFLAAHLSDINLSVTDQNFNDRLNLAYFALEKWINDQQLPG